MSNTRIFTCQWPACHYVASRLVKRGHTPSFLHMCVGHFDTFETLSNHEAAAIHRDAQPVQYYLANDQQIVIGDYSGVFAGRWSS